MKGIDRRIKNECRKKVFVFVRLRNYGYCNVMQTFTYRGTKEDACNKSKGEYEWKDHRFGTCIVLWRRICNLNLWIECFYKFWPLLIPKTSRLSNTTDHRRRAYSYNENDWINLVEKPKRFSIMQRYRSQSSNGEFINTVSIHIPHYCIIIHWKRW